MTNVDSQNAAVTDLASWFDAAAKAGQSMPKGEFARRCNISAAFLSQLLAGVRAANYETACRISTCTGGVVSIESLLTSPAKVARRKDAEANAKPRRVNDPELHELAPVWKGDR